MMRASGLTSSASRLVVLTLMLLALGLPSAASASVEVTNLGPLTYFRNPGKPTVYATAFPGVAGPGVLQIENSRVSAAVIRLNGAEVVSPSAFSQQVQLLTVPVTLTEHNRIEIELRSAPGSSLTLKATQQIDSDAAGVIGAGGGLIEVADAHSPVKGVRIEIPEGALVEPCLIRLRYDESIQIPKLAKQESFETAGLSILPDGTTFQKPVVISIPVPDVDDDGLVDGTDFPVDMGSIYSSRDGSEWVRAEAWYDVDGHALVAASTHFSIWQAKYHRWTPNSVVYYAIEDLPDNASYPEASFVADLENALSQWTNSLDRTIAFAPVGVTNPEKDILFRVGNFCNGSLGTDYKCNAAANAPITGPPTPNSYLAVTFNTNVPDKDGGDGGSALWVAGHYTPYPSAENARPFRRVVLHELGHAIGLGEYSHYFDWHDRYLPCNQQDGSVVHTDGFTRTRDGPILMYYECWALSPWMTLAAFDRAEARRLYGLAPELQVKYYTFSGKVTSTWHSDLTTGVRTNQPVDGLSVGSSVTYTFAVDLSRQQETVSGPPLLTHVSSDEVGRDYFWASYVSGSALSRPGEGTYWYSYTYGGQEYSNGLGASSGGLIDRRTMADSPTASRSDIIQVYGGCTGCSPFLVVGRSGILGFNYRERRADPSEIAASDAIYSDLTLTSISTGPMP